MNLFNKKLLAVSILSLSCIVPLQAAEDKLSMQELLQKVRQGRVSDNQDNKRREQAFINKKADQERLIAEARAQIAN